MPASVATVRSANASRYLQQLCKHWSHRFETEFTPTHGRIDFGEGRVLDLRADDDALSLGLAVADDGGLETMERVVADHLARFAFREDLAIDWRR